MEMTPFFFGLYKLVKYGVYPLTWVFLGLLTALVLAWLPPSPRRRRWLRGSLTLGLLILLMSSLPLASHAVMSLLESRYPPEPSVDGRFDAIVILGGGIQQRGTLRPADELSDESRRRTVCGVDLYQQGAAPTVLVTGGGTRIFGRGPREAPAMKEWAVRLGVPAEAIVVEDRARTTYENATGAVRVLGKTGSIVLVTNAAHLPRAAALFRKQGFDVLPYPCGYQARHRLAEVWTEATLLDLLPTSRALERMTEAVEEIAGLLLYRLAGRL